MNELKPCPFCGAKYDPDGGPDTPRLDMMVSFGIIDNYINCQTCGGESAHFHTRDFTYDNSGKYDPCGAQDRADQAAIDAWNRRPLSAVHSDGGDKGKRMKTIWLDVDGVLCDLTGAVLRQHEIETGEKIPVKKVQNWNWTPALSTRAAVSIFSAPAFWRNCNPYPGAHRFFENLMALEKPIVIATNAVTGGYDDKYEWLERFGFYGFRAICNNKIALFRLGDIVVDDYPYILNHALEIGAHPICIARPWNTAESKPAWEGERYDYQGAVGKIRSIVK